MAMETSIRKEIVMGNHIHDSKDIPSGKSVQKAVVAGQFYPQSSEDLSRYVRKYIDEATNSVDESVKAIIAPHAGYIYSGPIAGFAYKSLPKKFKRVFILASNHTGNVPYFNCSVADVDYFETPLGMVPVSPIVKEILNHPLCNYIEEAHLSHVIEVHLPFLQVTQDEFEIIPLITGSLSPDEVKQLGEALSRYADDETLFVISSDLSHYHPYTQACQLDKSCMEFIEQMNIKGVMRSEACGRDPILILLNIANRKGWQAKNLDYRNSGDTSGSTDQVVGYGATLFHDKQNDYTEEMKKRLLSLSRETLDAFIKEGRRVSIDKSKYEKPLSEVRGCFVTLHKNNQLRGCIGHIVGHLPLVEGIVENTISAAVKDPRFNPVSEDELDNIEIEISILSQPELLSEKDPKGILTFLKPNKHGVIIKNGHCQSTYLPQVWEQLPDKVEFLESLCFKGGMSQDSWKDSDTEIYVYEAMVFN